MKKSFLLFIPIFITSFLFAQTEELIIKKSAKGFYVDHKVTPKENFYSIGRLFNVPAKGIAAYNVLDMNKGLSIGQVIRIPLTDSNFSQKTNSGTPVYYKAAEKETLSHISSANNKITLANLRNWNNLSNDNIASGAKLIVGFLISREMPEVVIVKKEEPLVTPPKKDDKVASPNSKIMQVVSPDSASITSNKKDEKKPVIKDETGKEEKKTVMQKMPEDGFFKTYFEQQVKTYPLSKEETITSGIFKMVDGMKEAKYYALIDGVEPGTIIKVINPANNKTVYAKVLGEMKGIRQNEGLNMRISNTAASALEITEQDKFIVKVNY